MSAIPDDLIKFVKYMKPEWKEVFITWLRDFHDYADREGIHHGDFCYHEEPLHCDIAIFIKAVEN